MLVVDWPGYSHAPERVRAEQKVKAMIESMGGVFVRNPFAMTAFGGNRVIAHPLGGCAMGETVETAVVAPDGRVFDPTKGPKGVHDGLYVCDGAAASKGLRHRMFFISSRRSRCPMLGANSTSAPAGHRTSLTCRMTMHC